MPSYLDCNATAPVLPKARAASRAAIETVGNPSSPHRFGRAARRLLEEARERLAALVGADPAGVVFTSGATEANALAVAGSGAGRFIVSAVEHQSVWDSVHAQGSDACRRIVAVHEEGVLDLACLERVLAEFGGEGCLVSVMLAQNETGVLQPVAEAAALSRHYGALIHCDAAQAVGRLKVDMGALGVDMLSLSGHKFGAPAGIGALALSPGIALAPLVHGGGQERGRRAGTENTPAIAGLGAAAGAAPSRMATFAALSSLRDRFERELSTLPGRVTVFGAKSPRLANTSCFALKGWRSETLLMALDLEGVALSAGAACSSGRLAPSRVLQAMGAAKEDVDGALRLSLGWENDADDIDAALTALKRVISGALVHEEAGSFPLSIRGGGGTGPPA